jgi:hypothetical protein
MSILCKIFGHKWEPLEKGDGTISMLLCERCPGRYIAKAQKRNPVDVSKYMEVRRLTKKDCEEIYDFAIKRSNEILEGKE